MLLLAWLVLIEEGRSGVLMYRKCIVVCLCLRQNCSRGGTDLCIWIKLWKSTMTKSLVNTVLVWIWNRNMRGRILSCIYWYLKNANRAKLVYVCVFTEMWYKIHYKQFDVVKQFIVYFAPPYRGKRSHLHEETARITFILSYGYAECMKREWRGPYGIPASALWLYFSIYILCAFVASF